MVKVAWTELSVEDLKEIYDYISQDSVRYAEITVNKIYSRVQILRNHPRSGKIVLEFNDQYIREIISGNYRIVYRIVDESQVDIVRIYHSARLLDKESLK
jgi:addiction module RelE/StbE family toxin